ncbi:uncharacterized protein [Nicotiana tomentosiformis]|uniref:uncharacterized protein n=1 Tax=Nicotiana tomentosiformis TaxID=4098 RepID=UPI00388C67A1
MKEQMDKIMEVTKETGTDVAKLMMDMGATRRQGIRAFNSMTEKIDKITKEVETSYDSFCTKEIKEVALLQRKSFWLGHQKGNEIEGNKNNDKSKESKAIKKETKSNFLEKAVEASKKKRKEKKEQREFGLRDVLSYVDAICMANEEEEEEEIPLKRKEKEKLINELKEPKEKIKRLNAEMVSLKEESKHLKEKMLRDQEVATVRLDRLLQLQFIERDSVIVSSCTTEEPVPEDEVV